MYECFSDETGFEILNCIRSIENKHIFEPTMLYWSENVIIPAFIQQNLPPPSTTTLNRLLTHSGHANIYRKYQRIKYTNPPIIRRGFITEYFINFLETTIKPTAEFNIQFEIDNLINIWKSELDWTKQRYLENSAMNQNVVNNDLNLTEAIIEDQKNPINDTLTQEGVLNEINNSQNDQIILGNSMYNNIIDKLDPLSKFIIKIKTIFSIQKDKLCEYCEDTDAFLKLIHNYLKQYN